MNHIIDSIETDYDLHKERGLSEEVIKETLSEIWIPELVEEFFENKK
jgi:hypothetical protein